MSEVTEKDAAGKALYLEFRKADYTYQVIITPDVVSLDKQTVYPITMLSRRISTYHPRRKWAHQHSVLPSPLTRDADGNIEQMGLDYAIAFANTRVYSLVQPILDAIRNRGYALHKHPLFVEFSYKDAKSIFQNETPNDLYRRIVRSRTAFGWGDELVSDTSPATTV